jgi:hypothetical protein
LKSSPGGGREVVTDDVIILAGNAAVENYSRKLLGKLLCPRPPISEDLLANQQLGGWQQAASGLAG